MSFPKSFEKITTMTAATALSATVYNPATGYFPESLTNGALTSGTSWTGAGDFASSGNKAVYTNSSKAGTYTQASSAMARPGKSGARVKLTYTVSSPTGAAIAIAIPATFASVATSLTGLGVAGTYSVSFNLAATPADFVLSGTSAATASVALDTLSLLEYNEDYRQVKRAVISVETAAVNFTIDGSTPSVTSGINCGHLLNVGDILTLNDINEIRNFRAINAVASSGAILKVTYSVL